ncbi:hypothetical protein GCM10009682_25240 [Luedemannella flava]|uniref:PH domain-containing protein n=1 Tax=Luedemannella flava TaxID=349316 RepID=A0ABP4Y5S9_9ACTN
MVSTPPLRLTERIPADLPLVVHHNVRKRLLVYGSAYFAWCLVLLGPAALLVPTTAGRGVIAVVVAGGCLVPVVGFLLGVYLWALASRGPVLAAGPDGMWVKCRSVPVRAVWLPWESIELVSRSRWWAFERMIKIRPRDPDIRRQFGPAGTFDATIGWWYFGPPLSALLSFTDRAESEVLAAIERYSAGRLT